MGLLTMCGNKHCPIAKTCARHPNSGTKYTPHQSWARFVHDEEGCGDYVPKTALSSLQGASAGKIEGVL